MHKGMRLTKASRVALDNAAEIFIVMETDSVAQVYYTIECAVDGWYHTLSSADNSVPFSTVDDAVKYLLRKKVPFEKINLERSK
jgi:hypothetical protein